MKHVTLPKKKYIIVLIMITNASFLFAQNSDWGLWTSIDAEKNFLKKWDFSIDAQYRWKDNMSVTDQIRAGADISRKLGDYVKLGAGYELIAKHKVKNDEFVYRNRFRMQATGSYKYARFTASWRTRMQLTLLETDEARGDFFQGENNKWVWRNRFALKYNIRKTPFKPYINFELFHNLFDGMEYSYYQNRFGIGMEYSLNKRHTLEAGYKRETEIDAKRKYNLNVIKLGYVYSF
jgi:hypothetical protein